MQTGSLLAVPDMEERVKVAKKHLDFSVEWKGEKLGVLEMRRHYTNYFRGIPHFKPYRTSLVTTDEYAKVNDILEEVSTVFADEVF